jgi:hypothetical protein
MRSHLATAFALLAAALMLIQTHGCSILGLGIGAVSDANKPDTEVISGWDVKTIPSGTEIGIILRDGSEITGRYEGMGQLSPQEYDIRYSKCRQEQPEEIYLPAIGDTITVVSKSGDQLVGRFLGFDYRIMHVQLFDRSETNRAALNLIDTIEDNRGNVLEGERLKQLVFDGKIPFRSVIVVTGPVTKAVISLDEVHQIQIPAEKKGALTGFLLGAAVDIIIIAIAAKSGHSKPKTRRTGDPNIMCGCPFVYSFDGEEYRIDSETFGGSIFQAAQRTDLDRLDHLKAVEDICRLKLVNELQEIDYVDELKLLAVDHQAGSEIIPSFDGSLYSLSDFRKPSTAVDDRGNDVLHLIEEKDDRLWASNPFGRDPAIEAHIRDGVNLELPKPREATSVKLVFNTQNTFWGAYLQSHFLELHGRDLDKWYDVWNSSQEARQRLQEVMVREGMLLIKLWKGDSWQNAGFIWEVGASISRDQVVRLDISGIPSDVLRIRLESTPGIWTVNSVQADYSTDVPFQVIEASLEGATDHLGNDVSELLEEADGRYYVMDTEDWAKLSFSAPRKQDGLDRTYLVKSSGYYIIKVPADGEPQTKLLAQFMTQPGAFGRYTIQLLNEMTSFALAQ